MENSLTPVLKEEDLNIQNKPVSKQKESPVTKMCRLRCAKARSKKPQNLIFQKPYCSSRRECWTTKSNWRISGTK